MIEARILRMICLFAFLVLPIAPAVAQPSPVSIRLDSDLNARETEAITDDLAFFGSFPLNGSSVPFFREAFGGSTGAEVLRYLDERINWIVAPTRDTAPDDEDRENGVIAVAVNVGTAIWFGSIAEGLPGQDVRLNDTVISITSSRVGLIQIGSRYPDLPPLLRVSTLVHEARHSDCTGGLSPEDLQRLRNGQIPLAHGCGHTHSICPRGHEYAGMAACDEHPWGAYAIELQFLSAFTESCVACSTRDLALAFAIRADTASRILFLKDMLEGNHGPPDMSSAEVTVP